MTAAQKKYLLFGGLTLLFVLMAKGARAAYMVVTDWLIPQLEGFRANPYWDNKQYTWGYGTRAPGPTGTITRAKALEDMRAYIANDYAILSKLVTRQLNGNQWAAFLSFSYNEGIGNAKNLIAEINAGDQQALETNWKLYVYANHVVDEGLIERRNLEWEIWSGQIKP